MSTSIYQRNEVLKVHVANVEHGAMLVAQGAAFESRSQVFYFRFGDRVVRLINCGYDRGNDRCSVCYLSEDFGCAARRI